LIDDWASQSRLTFLNYNSLGQATSDDYSMAAVVGRADTTTSVIVANNHVTLTPSGSGYFYSNFGCIKATNKYGGISLTIKAAAGTAFSVQLQSSSTCSPDNPTSVELSAADLGWTFNNAEKSFTIPFSKFTGLDTDKLISVLFSINKAVTLGPMSFYCGSTGTQYPVPTTVAVVESTATVPATTGPSAFVIDTFTSADSNTLGFWHGGDDDTTYKITSSKLTINTKGNSDLSWYTQLSGGGCTNVAAYDTGYLHISFTGSADFTIALQQHNPTCDESIAPYPFTWDSVEGSRYSNTAKTEIYVPLAHFNIDRTKVIGIALKGFFTSSNSVFSKIEIVKTVPTGFLVPSKLSTAPLVFACTRPNSFAFSIDDGQPGYAQQVAASIAAAGVKVTFFTVGAALLDATTNFTAIYSDLAAKGHQIAYHSYTHPPMEGLPTLAAIDWELNMDIDAVKTTLGLQSKYFRPPFGTEGARVRQRLAALIPGSKFIAWSVDVEDYLWAASTTPEKQLEAFQRDVNKGGNLVVCHYLFESTVNYIPQFLAIAKATGKQLMRIDQCLEDPEAPPL
jgi:peptidoglycan/xylan/chitin deacetylase (PgdA/CDA1 family)